MTGAPRPFPARTPTTADLRRLASRTTVLATTVGPYARYGQEVVRACAEVGTHYADLTGELLFVRWSLDTVAVRARETGARIVHSCGFDSIPSDINTFLAAQRLQQIDSNASLGAVRSGFKAKGTFSGGTLASGIGMIEAGAEDRKLAMDPYALCPSEYLLTVDRSQTSDTDLRFGSSHSRR